MGTTTATQVTVITNQNILRQIKEGGTTKNALAKASGIAPTTFDRNLTGKTSWTVIELGSIAEALNLTLGDILPAELLTARIAD